METLIENTSNPSATSKDYHVSFQSGSLIACKYSGSQPLSQLPEVYDDSQSEVYDDSQPEVYDDSQPEVYDDSQQVHHTHSLCDQVSRFAAYFYTKHIRAPRHTSWCRDPQTLPRGATRMAFFDNDNWLLMRLPSQPIPLGHPILAFNGIGNIYTNWKRWDTALSAYYSDAAAHGKRPRRRVCLGSNDHSVSAFDFIEEDLVVLMEIDEDGELMFYHECRRCHDLTCRSCVKVLDRVVAFGLIFTQVKGTTRVE